MHSKTMTNVCAPLTLFALSLLGGTTSAAQHTSHQTAWTEAPLLTTARGFSRSVKLLRPRGLSIDSATVMPSVEPDEPVPQLDVPLQDGKLAVRTATAKQGGYYRVGAIERHEQGIRYASTVVYFSNPGPAPRALLAASIAPVEIVPQMLPREHRHYREGEHWPFVLRLNGQPVANHPVDFETAQGTRLALRTDAEGVIEVPFPHDIPPPAPDKDEHATHRSDPSSAFVLSANIDTADGKRLQAAFNLDYEAGAYAQANLWLGGGFAALGMLSAVPLLRRRKADRRPS